MTTDLHSLFDWSSDPDSFGDTQTTSGWSPNHKQPGTQSARPLSRRSSAGISRVPRVASIGAGRFERTGLDHSTSLFAKPSP